MSEPTPVSFVVTGEDDGRTLAQALRKRLPEVSWERLRKFIGSGKATVNGDIVHDPVRRLATGEAVAFSMQARRVEPLPDVYVTIIHEDGEVIVIDKPEGISSVPFEKRERGTAMDLVREAWRRQGRAHATATPLHVVHRIDKETSGLLMYAKSKRAEKALQAQLRAHTVERAYLCVAEGDVFSRTIHTHLVRNRGDGLRGSTRRLDQGKDAITHVKVIEQLTGCTYCEVRLETGKTHQIRIHLSEIGHPLVGDRVYTRDMLRRELTPIHCDRLLLHAATLGFVHPDGERNMRFESPLPPSFETALRRLRKR
jgi:23S rRNA pseudouridine1911/1915/1917 synthase